MDMTRTDQAKANRIIRAASMRAGASRDEIAAIQKTVWEVRSIVSRDRDRGYLKAAAVIAADIGPLYAFAALKRLNQIGIVGDEDFENTVKLIENKHKAKIDSSNKISNIFNQAITAASDAGFMLLGSEDQDSRSIGKNRTGTSGRVIAGDEEERGPNTNNSSRKIARDYYRSAGLKGNVRDEMMPVTGYLVHNDHIKKKKQSVLRAGTGNAENDAIFEVGDEDIIGNGLTADGEIEVVLKPGVSQRVSYGMGRGIKNGNKPVKLNSTNKEDVSDAIASLEGINGKKESMEAMLNLLASSIDDDFSEINSSFDENGKMRRVQQFDDVSRKRKPIEAHILGGFDVDEIEQINYPFSKLNRLSINEKIDDVVNNKFINRILANAGLNSEEIEYIVSTGIYNNINTESMQMLRNYRYAQKLKSKYRENGISKFRIAHPSGIDIENPMSHSKGARPGQNVEEVLVESIRKEVMDMAQKLVKDLRKPDKPSLVSRKYGGKL